MNRTYSLTDGNILSSLIKFALPVFFALLLQALYGGADLLIVGRFSPTSDVSGVATGSMFLQTVTMIIIGLSMGVTILVGEHTGRKEHDKTSHTIGSGICLFSLLAIALTLIIVIFADKFSSILHAPPEAFDETTSYIRICGAGSVFITAYNLLGAIFRGMGDSKTPLMTVAIACIVNILGDLLLVAVFNMGASGAAIATVAAQAVSVIISLFIIKKRTLPFKFTLSHIKFDLRIIVMQLKLGTPIALQDFLVGISFLVIQTVVNTFGVVASAGVGVAEKVCVFLMLVPSAYMQSMSAFTAQNMGAGNPVRAKKALFYGIMTAFAAGLLMGVTAFFYGDILSSLFSGESQVIAASHSYLKAYAIDCLLTPFLFCFMGYYNGCERTLFVMIEGIIGAFLVRIPVVYLMSSLPNASLFQIGLGTPASSLVQIILCLGMFIYLEKKSKQ